MARLTALALKAKVAAAVRAPTRKAVRIMDTEGLSLLLPARKLGAAPSERGAWVLRFTFAAKRHDMGLGGYPDLGLAEARAKAAEARAKLREGVNPQSARADARNAMIADAAEDRTFAAIAAACIAAKAPGWRNGKHAAQWSATLAVHAFPTLGKVPVALVTTEHVLRVLQPIWVKTPETAARVRGRIEAILDYARARKLRTGDNPARWRGNLAELLPAASKVARVVHHPSLPWGEVPAFLTALERRRGMAALALRFAVLTAARTGEVRGATWAEVDLAAAVWSIPGRRMKSGRLHRVPLSGGALALLERVRLGTPAASALVFAGPVKGKALSDMSMSMLTRGMSLDGLPDGDPPRWRDAEGRGATPHGFRASFRQWAAETRPEGREVAEAALAHAIRDRVEAAYQRSDLLERRRPLMEGWAAFCIRQPGGKVVHLHRESGR